MKNNLRIILFYVIIAVLFISFAGKLLSDMDSIRKDPVYSDVKDLFKNEEVKQFEVTEDNILNIVLQDGGKVSYRLRSVDYFILELGDLIDRQKEEGIITSYDYRAPQPQAWWVSFLPYVLIIGFFCVMWYFVMNQAMGGSGGIGKGGRMNSFGRARAKLGSDEKKKVLFSDVAGADEEKEELQEVVEFLKAPEKFSELGARIPRGVLLVGPPGTGKTLLAKAVAGEAGVPFYSISGSDFVEMYVGVGASRVRDLFDNAKKNSPCIIFIDEIDAVGRHRGAGLGGGHDEREQTLNQLLVEMDGFGSNDGVIVIAATNRPDILDPALLRPGRFDRQVTVNYPDLKGRVDILNVHAKGKPFEDSVDMEKIAQATVGFTGADLANLLNEAALHAARRHKRLIGMSDIEDAMLKIMVGAQKKSRKFKPDERKKTAYHEAGHAIIAHVLPSVDPVRQISIIPSGRALGYTLTVPLEDKVSVYKNGLKEEITMMLGGRVAEKIFFDDISGGASNDIQRATAVARNMVTRYGMSDVLGPVAYASEHSDDEIFLGRDFNSQKNYSEHTAALIDSEIKKIIDEAFERAEKILRENSDKVEFIGQYLVDHEVMDADQFEAVMNGDATVEKLEAIAEEKRKKSRTENSKREEELRAKKEEEAQNSAESENTEGADGSDENGFDDSNR